MLFGTDDYSGDFIIGLSDHRADYLEAYRAATRQEDRPISPYTLIVIGCATALSVMAIAFVWTVLTFGPAWTLVHGAG